MGESNRCTHSAFARRTGDLGGLVSVTDGGRAPGATSADDFAGDGWSAESAHCETDGDFAADRAVVAGTIPGQAPGGS